MQGTLNDAMRKMQILL